MVALANRFYQDCLDAGLDALEARAMQMEAGE